MSLSHVKSLELISKISFVIIVTEFPFFEFSPPNSVIEISGDVTTKKIPARDRTEKFGKFFIKVAKVNFCTKNHTLR